MLRSPRVGFVWEVLPGLVYVALVFYGGVAHIQQLPGLAGLPADKIYHALAFALMQWLLFRALRFEWPALSMAKQLLWALFMSSLIGGLIEFLQALLPYRSAEFLDWVADSIGAGLAAGVLRVALPRRSAPAQTSASVPQPVPPTEPFAPKLERDE